MVHLVALRRRRFFIASCLLSALGMFAFGAPRQAHAAITVDATSTATVPAGSTSLTLSHPLGTGGSRMVVCGVTYGYNDTALSAPLSPAPSMTFDGVAMTSFVQGPTHAQNSTSKVFSQIFYINDASLTSSRGGGTLYSVVLTIPTAVTGGAAAGCTSLFGVSQAGPEPATATSTAYSGTSAAPTTPASLITANANDWVIDAFAGGHTTSGTASPNAGQTQLYYTSTPSGALTTAGMSNGTKGGVDAGGSYEVVVAAGTTVKPGWMTPAPGQTATVSRQAYAIAAFPPDTTTSYTVTTAVAPTGGGTVSLNPSAASYASGTQVTVTATPSIGYAFSNFTGDVTGTTNPATLVVNSNASLTANFVAVPCVLTINIVGQGTVTPASGTSYTCGTQVQVTATAANGYAFGQFSGALTGTANPQTLTLNANATVTATFVQGSNCTLTTSVTGSGSINVSPSGTSFSCGTQVQITAVPATNYSFTGFSGDLTGTTNPQTLTLNNPNSSVNAAFTQTSYPVNVTINGPGTVALSPSGGSYAPGTQVSVTATPNSGALFTGYAGALTGTANPQTLTVGTGANANNVTANFANAVITQDAVSHGVSKGTATSITWTHVLGAGTNRAVVIAVGQTDTLASPDSSSVVTSVLFNGVYATPVPNSIINGGTSGSVQTQLFYLLDSELPAAAGTYPIQVNLAGSVAGVQGGAISFFGVNQGPADAVVTNRNTQGADLISTSITTLVNNDVVVDILEDNNVAALTANTGQAVAWSASATSGTGGSSTKVVPTAGPTTLGWAGSASRLAHSLAAFAPATAVVPPTYTLTTSVAGGVGGSITTNPGLSAYPLSTGVLLTATAQTGYAFSGWTGDYTSSANPLPITMDTNRNVVANFVTAATCTLTLNIVGNGSVTPAAGIYNCGTVLHFVATPGAGYTFTSYSGDFNSNDNPTDFTLSANANITVEFDAIPYCMLTTSTSGQGSVTPTGSGSYPCGSTITLQATASAGSAFSGFSGDLTTTANPTSFQLNQNSSITANFTTGAACTLTTTVVGQGTVTPSSGSYACGTTISIQATPASKYLFSGFSGDLTSSTSPAMLTLNTNKSVTATFTVNTAGVTGDSRTVVEPTYPSVCSTLIAVQTAGSLVESSPDTARVQSALNACAVGQAVEFSSNGSANAFIIAPITLPAGVTMLVDPEVTIFGSINSADYPCNSSSGVCTPLIDVAANTAPAPGSGIMGLGVIDGRGGVPLTDKGKSWWSMASNPRPRLVFLSSSSNLSPADNFTMYKITLKNSPKFEFSGIGNNLTIWGVKIIAPPDSPNTDGIDPSASQNITITNSYISDGDDMIALKAGNGHVSNVTISNNHLYTGHGITVGSETNAGLNNMLVINDAIDNGFGGSSADSLRIKSDTSRGGEVYDVLYKNICINHGADTIVIDPYYSSETGNLIPNFHDITFSNVHKLIHDSSHKSTIQGYNTGGIVYPAVVTFDTVYFDGDSANDFKAPDNFNNANFTLGAGPVSFASFLTADAAVPANLITVTNSVSNANTALDCSTAFVYLAGDLTASKTAVTAGTSPVVTAVLQNVVSPLVAGTISYPQQNAPSGTVQLLEGSTVVGNGVLNGRLAYISVPNITQGSHTYTANFLGDSNYSAMPFGSITLIATAPAAVATITGGTTSVSYGTGPAVLTASISYNGTTAPTGAVTFTVNGTPLSASCSGSSSPLACTATYSASANLAVNSYAVSISQAADGTYPPASGAGTLNVVAVAPTITFTVPNHVYGDAPFSVAATSNSTGSFTYSVVSGPASVTGSTVTLTGGGTVVLLATEAADANYSVGSKQASFMVSSAAPTISFTVPNHVYGDAPFSVAATSNSTGAFTYSVVSGPASVTGSTVTLTGAGTVVLLATEAADSSYSVGSKQASFMVSGATPTISFTVPNHVYGDAPFSVAATSNSTGAFTYSVVSGPASVTGSTVTLTGAGTVVLLATEAADANYSVGSKQASFMVSGATPTISFTVPNHVYGDAPFSVAATSNSTGSFTYSVVSGPASVTGSTVTLTGAGMVVLLASEAADSSYSVGSKQASFMVSGATPTISFTVPNHVYGDAPFSVAATSNSTGSFTYSVVSGPASVTGSTVTLTGAGTVVLLASEAADSSYSVGSKQASFMVSGATPTISFTVPNHVYGDAPFSVAATSNSTGSFTYSVVSGPASVTGSTVTLTGAGTVVLLASEAADSSYSVGSKQASFMVSGATPTISFTVPNHVYGDAPFSVAATSNSTGSFTYSVVSGPASVTGSTVTLTGAGTVVLLASEAADSNYSAGTKQASFTVSSVAPTISFTVPNHVYGDAPFSVAATSNSTGSFTYSVVSGPASVTGSTVTLTGAGMVVLLASEAADSNYSAGTKQASFTVSSVAPTISFTVPNHVYGDAPFSVAATSNSTGSFTYSVVSGPASVTGSTVTLTGAGMVVLLASEAADSNYSAGTKQASFTVSSTTPTISFTVPNHVYGDAPFSVAATSNSTGSFTYSVVSGPASVTGSTVTLTGAGKVVLLASEAADSNYSVGSKQASFNVSAAPVIDFSFTDVAASAVTVVPGNIANYSFSVSPGSGPYPGPITFIVTGLPPGATATFSPSSIAANAGPQSVMLAVQTAGPVASHKVPGLFSRGDTALFALILLPWLSRMRKGRRRLNARLLSLFLLLGGMAGILGISGCGAGTGFLMQSPVTYNLTVTATSGALSHSQTVTLIVQ